MEEDQARAWPLILKYSNRQFLSKMLRNDFTIIEEVVQTPGRVIQSSSIILPIQIFIHSQNVNSPINAKTSFDELFCVLKIASFGQQYYRNRNHRDRTVASYQNEIAFFQKVQDNNKTNASNYSELNIPQLYGHIYDPEEECLVVLMSDIRQNPKQQLNMTTLRSQEQRLALNFNETKHVLEWLAKFHAQFFQYMQIFDENQLWEKGGYWSLDKRMKDIEQIPQQWQQLINNFGDEILQLAPNVAQLGEYLKQNALIWHDQLFENQKNDSVRKWYTCVHGDLKTANIFIQDTGVAVCDFQWSGWGLPVLDIVYLLYTSVQPNVVEVSEYKLLEYYYQSLWAVVASESRKQLFTFETFVQWYEIAYLDYVRYLVGSMWGKITPASLTNNQEQINQGMHKRDKKHLFNMITKGMSLSGINAQQRRPQMSLVVQVLSEAVKVAYAAGQEITRITHSQQSLRVRNKGVDGPQTIADVASERIIINHLSAKFPGLLIIGEEGSSQQGFSNPDHHQQKIQQAPEYVATSLRELDAYIECDVSDLTVWVDPLDGTREFLSGNLAGVTVLIGIAVKGRPVAGVVHQPFRLGQDGSNGTLWWGIIGHGVFVGPHQYIADTSQDSNRCIVATTKTWAFNLPKDQTNLLKPQKVINVGGAGNKTIMLLEGKITQWIFPRTGTKRWDTCASEALLCAFGGKLVDSFGNTYNYDGNTQDYENNNGVVAARSANAWQRCKNAFLWQ